MSKRFLLKLVLFISIFFSITAFLSLFLINDLNTYTRVLMHEFYSQKNIDVLFCGASHVSHGINPKVADKILGLDTFNSGTPNQGLDGTYTLLREAERLYSLKSVFVELDFATAATAPYSKSESSKSNFLVSHYLKNPKAKLDYILSSTSPKYYLNSFLPIGKDKLIDLNPLSVLAMAKSRFTGEYFKYSYKKSDSEYAGKGCVLDDDAVKEGSFWSGPVKPIYVSAIDSEWKETIVKIIKLCKKKNISLAFYQNPSTDFYLVEKQTYDDYISLIKNLLSEYNVPYYDFSLIKSEYLQLADSDFADDNHLNRQGIDKFTKLFCNFYTATEQEKETMFYSSLAEKHSAQSPRIYGLIIDENKDEGFFTLKPVFNRRDTSLVSYDVFAYDSTSGNEILVAEKSGECKFYYPSKMSGIIKITSYYNGVVQNFVEKYFTAL